MQNIANTKASFVHAFRSALYQAILLPAVMLATAVIMATIGLSLFAAEGLPGGDTVTVFFILILVACPVVFEIIFKKVVNRSARLVSQKYAISSAKRVAITSTLMFLFIAPLAQLLFIPILIPFLGIFYSVFYALIFYILLFLIVHPIIFYYFTKIAFQNITDSHKRVT